MKIYFVRQKTSPKISDNFPMALRGKMLTRFHRNPYLHVSVIFVQFTWSATTTITTPEHVSGIRRYGMATFYVMRWMTYCEGAILSLTHSFIHSVVSSVCNRWVSSAGSPRAKHNFLDRLRPNIPLLETLFMGYFKSRVEHLCDVNKKNNGSWSLYPL